MSAQTTMPYPMRRMLEYLDIDIERGIELLPTEIQDSFRRCRRCDRFDTCDYNVESRYFQCPNRELLDRLEDLLN
ncbi:MAG: hypothetical protein QF578_02950 [Alphaproteobacteria bacterium]|jgi:hypothetical protein|nr:hypothetical protein [Alphaproteobacteria bacterium]MDP6814108.1 hypothetical protein [Alphaproteobacteria bacterium]